MKENYYRILGLDNFASPEEIRKRYLRLAKKYHPDRNPEKPEYEDLFKRISNAYQNLADPEKKARYDLALRYTLEKAPSSYSRPIYAQRRRYYTTEAREYTRTARMYGRLFIFVFILAVIGIPMLLFYYTSIKAYEKGLQEYEKGNKIEALNEFNRAIMFFGGRSVEAAIKGCEICIYDLNIYEQGHYFANNGLTYAEDDEDIAILYFLKSLAYQGQEKYDMALKTLTKADSLGYWQDSIQLRSGMVLAYGLEHYDEAINKFDYLIEHNIHLDKAWFGKAWSLQNLGRYSEAIKSFGEVIAINMDQPLAYYYRGMNHIAQNDTTAACDDFQKALGLGYTRAKESLENYCD